MNETMDNETAPSISSLEGVSYLFGFPITHSLSPLLHNTVYDSLKMSRVQIPLPSTSLPDLLTRINSIATPDSPPVFGASVTMPHKIAILPHLDELSPAVREVGSCNTIVVRTEPATGRRILCGENTDVVGIREAFARNVQPDILARTVVGKPGLVIGGGGAARSAVYALLRYFDCGTVYLVNRDPNEVETLIQAHEETQARLVAQGHTERASGKLVHVATIKQAQQLAAASPPGAVVSCVPDFPPVTQAELEARDIMQVLLEAEPAASEAGDSARAGEKGAVLEMCYHPQPWTRIASLSRAADRPVVLGTEAMIWQGLEQDRHWLGLDSVETLPIEQAKRAVAQALARALPRSEEVSPAAVEKGEVKGEVVEIAERVVESEGVKARL